MGRYYSMLIYMSMEINVSGMNMGYNSRMVLNFHVSFFQLMIPLSAARYPAPLPSKEE
jgi:hypothetical protein